MATRVLSPSLAQPWEWLCPKFCVLVVLIVTQVLVLVLYNSSYVFLPYLSLLSTASSSPGPLIYCILSFLLILKRSFQLRCVLGFSECVLCCPDPVLGQRHSFLQLRGILVAEGCPLSCSPGLAFSWGKSPHPRSCLSLGSAFKVELDTLHASKVGILAPELLVGPHCSSTPPSA